MNNISKQHTRPNLGGKGGQPPPASVTHDEMVPVGFMWGFSDSVTIYYSLEDGMHIFECPGVISAHSADSDLRAAFEEIIRVTTEMATVHSGVAVECLVQWTFEEFKAHLDSPLGLAAGHIAVPARIVYAQTPPN